MKDSRAIEFIGRRARMVFLAYVTSGYVTVVKIRRQEIEQYWESVVHHQFTPYKTNLAILYNDTISKQENRWLACRLAHRCDLWCYDKMEQKCDVIEDGTLEKGSI